MTKPEFNKAPWFLGEPYTHRNELSEWCNVYADGERNIIAKVLVRDGEKLYFNAPLIKSAPKMYDMLEYIARAFIPTDICIEINALLAEIREEDNAIR